MQNQPLLSKDTGIHRPLWALSIMEIAVFKINTTSLFALFLSTLILVAGLASSGCNCNGVPPLPSVEDGGGDGGIQKEGVADAAPEKTPEPEVTPEPQLEPKPELQPEPTPEPKPEVPQFGTIEVRNRITNCLYGLGQVTLNGPSGPVVIKPADAYMNMQAKPGLYTIKLKVAPHCQLSRVTTADGSVIGEMNDFPQTLKAGGRIVYDVQYTGKFEAEVVSVTKSRIIVGGTSNNLVGDYNFFGYSTLTKPLDAIEVECGATGYGGSSCLPVQSVKLTCAGKVYKGDLVAGKYLFQGMSCVPANPKDPLKVQLEFDATPITSGSFLLSGIQFRLHLNPSPNSGLTIIGQDKLPGFVLRKSLPVFSLLPKGSSVMPTTLTDVHKTKVSAQGGDVAFLRLIYRISTANWSSGSQADIYGFEFHDKSGKVADAHIWAISKVSGKSANVGDSDGGDGLSSLTQGIIDGDYYVIVGLKNEAIVSAGTSNDYSLRLLTRGALTNASMLVKLEGDLGPYKIVAPGCGPNWYTAKVYPGVTIKAGDLFKARTAPNFIWSDMSGGDGTVAKVHTAPTINADQVVANSGTCDWTGGDLLGIQDMAGFAFKK